MDAEGQTQLSFLSGVTALRRHWLVALLCFVLVPAAALVASLLQTTQYSATASLLFRAPGFDESLFGKEVTNFNIDPNRQAATNLRLVSLPVVADKTAEEVDQGLTGIEVSSKVDVQPQADSDVVSITATDPSATRAAEIANTFAQSYVAFRREADQRKIANAIQLIKRSLDQLSPEEKQGKEGVTLQRQISRLNTLSALQTGNAEIVEKADVPDSPSSPGTLRNTAIGVLLGLALGVALALLVDRLDRRLKAPEELESAYSLPLLCTVPESRSLQVDDVKAMENGAPHILPFAEAEAFRMLRARLRYFNVDRRITSLVVTSAQPGEGKSTIAWNCAATAAAAGAEVLVLEADLHKPFFAEHHNLAPLPGLAEVLTGQSSFEGAVQRVAVGDGTNGDSTARRHLHVVVAGGQPPNPAELLESGEMAALLTDATNRFDLVVIDTPPAALLADAIPLMKLATGVILVGRVNQLTRTDAARLSQQLREFDAPVLGLVANRVRTRGRRYGYGYYTLIAVTVLSVDLRRRRDSQPAMMQTISSLRIVEVARRASLTNAALTALAAGTAVTVGTAIALAPTPLLPLFALAVCAACTASRRLHSSYSSVPLCFFRSTLTSHQ